MIGVEFEAGAGDLEAIDEGGVELIELDAAVEAGAEGVDDFGLKRGAGAVQEDVAGDESRDDEDGCDGAEPQKSDDEGVMTARGRAGLTAGSAV